MTWDEFFRVLQTEINRDLLNVSAVYHHTVYQKLLRKFYGRFLDTSNIHNQACFWDALNTRFYAFKDTTPTVYFQQSPPEVSANFAAFLGLTPPEFTRMLEVEE